MDNKVSADAAGRPRRRARWLGMGCCALLVGVSIYSAAGFALAPINPLLAAYLAPGHSVTNVQQVRLQMATARSRAELPALQALAASTLAQSPLDHETARTFAVVDLISNRAVRGNKVMELIGRATLREAVTHAWLLNSSFRARDYHAVAREADIILRLDSKLRDSSFQMLRALVADGRAIPALYQILATNPPWRSGFLQDLGQNGRSPSNELRLFQLLRASASPPTADELRPWFLKQFTRVSSATLYRRYAELSPNRFSAAERFVRDGDFEGTRAFAPFTWNTYTTDHGFAEVGPSPDGPGRALYTESDGSFNGGSAVQLLTLRPGNYVLRYRTYPLTTIPQDSANFELTCREGSGHVWFARMPIRGTPSLWQGQSWNFTVPDGCDGPFLWLKWEQVTLRTATQFYIDDVAIVPGPARRPAPVQPVAPQTESPQTLPSSPSE